MLELNYPNQYQAWQQSVIDQAVEMGINRVRMEISPPHTENSVDYIQQYLDGQITLSEATIDKVAVNDNSDSNIINPNGFKWTWFDFVMNATVMPLRARLAQQGETLWINVLPASFAYNTLHKTNPSEYAEFALATYQHMQSTFGVVPDSWEIALEPDLKNPDNWNAAGIAAATVATQDKLLAHGFTPNFILPSTTSGPAAKTWYNNIKAANPAALTYVSEVSYHRYVGIDNSLLTQFRITAAADGKTLAMLEKGGADYYVLHTDLSVGWVTSWQQFVLASDIANGDNGYHYFAIDTQSHAVTITSRAKFLRQYFKFVRRGAVRIEASSSNSLLEPLAFINADGSYVLVVKSGGAATFTAQLPSATYGIKYTTSTQYNVDLPNQTGGLISTSIPAAGVITIYGLNGGPPPTPTPTPTATPTPTPTPSVTPTPSPTPTPTPTPTPSGNLQIAGRTRTASGVPIVGITVNLTGDATRTAVTNSQGTYLFTGLSSGTYTITPVSSSWTFTPTSRTLTISSSQVGVNFTGN